MPAQSPIKPTARRISEQPMKGGEMAKKQPKKPVKKAATKKKAY